MRCGENPRRFVLCVFLGLVVAWAVPVVAPAGDASAPSAAADKPEAPADAASGLLPANPGLGEADTGIWQEIDPAELEKLIQRAEQVRLSDERKKVVEELRDNMLYDPDAVAKAVAALEKDPRNTQADNVERIGKALAAVDRKFAQPYRLYAEGKYKDAVQAAKDIRDAKQTNYLSAAVHLLYADALAKHAEELAKDADKPKTATLVHHLAAEAYAELLETMPERISFAVTASLKAAEIYEQIDRYYYAMGMYGLCLKHYGLTLSADEFERIRLKLEQWQETYKKPLFSIAEKMGEVEKRLRGSDSGRQTQKKGREVVLLLEDLIKTIEEKQCGGGQGQGKGQKKGRRQGQGKGGQGKGGSKGGPAAGTGQPTSPATASRLVTGHVQRPGKLSAVRPTEESGEWAKLPPRQRQQLEQIMKRAMSERNRDQIRDYLAAIAKEPDKPSE